MAERQDDPVADFEARTTSIESALLRDDRDGAFRLVLEQLVAAERLPARAFLNKTARDTLALATTRFLVAAAASLTAISGLFKESDFRQLMFLNGVFTALRAFGDDAPIRQLRQRTMERLAGGRGSAPLADVLVLIAASTLDEIGAPELEVIRRLPPAYSGDAVLGLLFYRLTLTLKAEAARAALINMSDRLEHVTLDALGLERAHEVWFSSSYAVAPDKHDLKTSLNKAYVERFTPPAFLTPARRNGKPVLLVMMEVMTRDHVNYRCYGASIAQLRSSFHTVLLAREGDTDDAVRALFDDYVAAPEASEDLLQAAASIRAAIILYPSVGLRSWAMVASNFRLAPIQVMSMACPATSRSAHMDYVLHGYEILEYADCFSERLVRMNAPGMLLSPHPEDDFLPRPAARASGRVRVAVRANWRKLNGHMLAACRRIQDAAISEVEFHFFPNAGPFWMHTLSIEMARLGLRSVVHAPAPFRTYRDKLAACDLSLSPYPFGNAVSTIDALLAGLPVVAMVGREPHERTDARFLRAAGLERWLVESEQDYCAAAVRLVDSAALRAEVSASLAGLRERLFEDEHALYANEFATVMRWIYDNDASMRAGGERIIGPRDWTQPLKPGESSPCAPS